MKSLLYKTLFLIALCSPCILRSEVYVGIGKTNLTPPMGTPSAGYPARKGEGIYHVHDPLQATALFIDNREKQIVLCGVDHLGLLHSIVHKITQKVRAFPELRMCEIYIGSSHTHSGGGAYLDIPGFGEALAGKFNSEVVELYIDQTVKAIFDAYQNRIPAKIGIGYGNAEGISMYRAKWPLDVSSRSDVAIIKVTKLDGSPFALLCNYPLHPTVLRSQNLSFSADFVGYTRDHIQKILGAETVYFNGAQGDIVPVQADNEFETCETIGKCLAQSVEKIWQDTPVSENITISTRKETYCFTTVPTPAGFKYPGEKYSTEMNVLVFNDEHAFVTIPGELSCIYDQRLKELGKKIGYKHVSIFGLTNDAHGYIILPESWQKKTDESFLSFGGENYGEETYQRAAQLLEALAPCLSDL